MGRSAGSEEEARATARKRKATLPPNGICAAARRLVEAVSARNASECDAEGATARAPSSRRHGRLHDPRDPRPRRAAGLHCRGAPARGNPRGTLPSTQRISGPDGDGITIELSPLLALPKSERELQRVASASAAHLLSDSGANGSGSDASEPESDSEPLWGPKPFTRVP